MCRLHISRTLALLQGSQRVISAHVMCCPRTMLQWPIKAWARRPPRLGGGPAVSLGLEHWHGAITCLLEHWHRAITCLLEHWHWSRDLPTGTLAQDRDLATGTLARYGYLATQTLSWGRHLATGKLAQGHHLATDTGTGPPPCYWSTGKGLSPGYWNTGSEPSPDYWNTGTGPSPGYWNTGTGPSPCYWNTGTEPSSGYWNTGTGPSPGYWNTVTGPLPGYSNTDMGCHLATEYCIYTSRHLTPKSCIHLQVLQYSYSYSFPTPVSVSVHVIPSFQLGQDAILRNIQEVPHLDLGKTGSSYNQGGNTRAGQTIDKDWRGRRGCPGEAGAGGPRWGLERRQGRAGYWCQAVEEVGRRPAPGGCVATVLYYTV